MEKKLIVSNCRVSELGSCGDRGVVDERAKHLRRGFVTVCRDSDTGNRRVSRSTPPFFYWRVSALISGPPLFLAGRTSASRTPVNETYVGRRSDGGDTRGGVVDTFDRFIVGSLASTLLACLSGAAAGGAIVLGARGTLVAVGCFGFIAIVANPAGFILAFALMGSPHRWRWLLSWSAALGTTFCLLTWKFAYWAA